LKVQDPSYGHQEGSAAVTATSPARKAEVELVDHHHGPYRAGLPPNSLLRKLWRRRIFVAKMSSATMQADNTSTFLGQAWPIINSLLLAAVNYILVTIVRPGACHLG
jgi:teichoic acid transport system permease protein